MGHVDPFVFQFSIFVMAVFVGYYVVWSVTPALHTPLMSVTNAISSVIVVGALLAVGVADRRLRHRSVARVLGFIALIFASINIFGGFLVTAAHARDVPEERGKNEAGSVDHERQVSSRCFISSQACCSFSRCAACRVSGNKPAGQPVRHDRHDDRDAHDAWPRIRRLARSPGCW